jgi:hypothetical protein
MSIRRGRRGGHDLGTVERWPRMLNQFSTGRES